MHYEKSCGAVIYRVHQNELQVLLVKQYPGGHWAFPKGHVEPDEEEVETAIREVKEETGLVIQIDPHFRTTVRYLVAPETEKEVVYFAAQPLSEVILRQEDEIEDIQWISFPEALKKITFNNDRKTLIALKNYVKEDSI